MTKGDGLDRVTKVARKKRVHLPLLEDDQGAKVVAARPVRREQVCGAPMARGHGRRSTRAGRLYDISETALEQNHGSPGSGSALFLTAFSACVRLIET